MNETSFEVINTEEKSYWLGFLAADGGLSSSQKTISLTQSKKDYNHLLKYINFLDLSTKIEEKIKFIFNSKYISYRIRFTSRKVYNDLLDKGITERKSLTLLPPRNVPDELIRHWIRGYFDGDGSVSSNKRIQMSILGTREVLSFISKILELSVKIRNKGTTKAFSIKINGERQIYWIYNFLYKDSNIYLDRKYNKFRRFYAG